MNSCYTLTNLAASCDAVKKVGGVKSRYWIGQKPDLATLTFGTNGEVLTMTLKSGKKLGKFEGMQYKNTASTETVPNETRNMFNQTFTGVLFYKTQAELDAIEKLLIGDRYFVLYETEAGQIKVKGIDQNPFNATDLGVNRGMNITVGSGGDGTVFADSTGVTCTMVGEMFNFDKLYKPATAIATVIAELDALSA